MLLLIYNYYFFYLIHMIKKDIIKMYYDSF